MVGTAQRDRTRGDASGGHPRSLHIRGDGNVWGYPIHGAVARRGGKPQPILIALFAFQLLSGLRLLWAAIPQRADIYSSIQTATGSYLVVYITSHLIAVFILGRIFLGIDTTFAWASGTPVGLLRDPWNVRLIPHYSLATLFVISHLAMGLRAVLLGHGVQVASANRLAWIICGIGLGVALIIIIAQLSVSA
jgi:hypothetical protein